MMKLLSSASLLVLAILTLATILTDSNIGESLPVSSTKMKEISVNEDDIIYSKKTKTFRLSPIVMEEYKLIYFGIPKIGSTTWKQCFRRMNNATNWRAHEADNGGLPHNPRLNGLKFLWDYSLEEAKQLMNSPDYTRAIFLRDPKERFLSVFLDKAIRYPNFIRKMCCPKTHDCVEPAQTLEGFLNLVQTCDNYHWRPQKKRMDAKYWPYINFVGRFDSLEEDAERLLRHLGAWEANGKSGWGANKTLRIFQRGSNIQVHQTNAKSKESKYFTPKLERLVEDFYSMDYNFPLFNFTKKDLSSS